MPRKSAEAPADKPAAPPKPTTPDGTKARRPRANVARSFKQLAEEREAEQRQRDHDLYGDLLRDITYLRRKFPVSREGKMIRVGGTLRTEAEVSEIAARERRLEQPAPAMLSAIATARTGRTMVPASAGSSSPAKVLPKPAVESLLCEDCGTAARLPGRPVCRDCSIERTREAVTVANRRKPAPEPKTAATPEPPAATEAAPPATPAPAEPNAEPERCRCGKPKGHDGRCWSWQRAASPYCAKCQEPRTDDEPLCQFCREAVEEKAAATAPATSAPSAGYCRCGRPDKHYGRCWARRGLDGPARSTPAPAPIPTSATPPPAVDQPSAEHPDKFARLADEASAPKPEACQEPEFSMDALVRGLIARVAKLEIQNAATEAVLAELRAQLGTGGGR